MIYERLKPFVILLAGFTAACSDNPITPAVEGASISRTSTEVSGVDGRDAVLGCGGKTNPCPLLPVNPNVPPPECDPWLDPGWCQGEFQCMESIAPVSPVYVGIASCPPGGWPTDPTLPGGPGGSIPEPEDENCDPVIHPDCEQPLTESDTATIWLALRTMVRPQAQFTDTAAARSCAEMETWFRGMMAAGDVFRGRIDSDEHNDPRGDHYGAYDVATGRIHFDPWALDAALVAGAANDLRELAITAFHEAAHSQGRRHPAGPTFDAQNRDSYSDPPFNHLNPGPNSCIPR